MSFGRRMADKSDAQLVRESVQAGNTAAFGKLVRRYQGRVYGLAYSIIGDWSDAQDLTQESFVRAFMKLRELREPQAFAAWLRQIAFRTCMDSLRTLRPEQANLVNDFDELINESDSPAESVEKTEAKEAVLAAVRQLPAKYRIPLTMFHIDQQSHESVAEFLGVPIGTVKSLISRGREMLRPMLAGHMEVSTMLNSSLSQKLPDDFSARVVALLDAAKSNDATKVAQLLKLDPALLDARGDENATAINLAAHYGHDQLIKQLIASGADAIEAAHWAHHGKPGRHAAIVELLRKHVWEHDERLKRLVAEYAATDAHGEDWRTSQLVIKEYPAETYLVLSSGTPVGTSEITGLQARFFQLVRELRKQVPLPQNTPNTFFYRQVSDEPKRWIFENGFSVPNDFDLPPGELTLKSVPPTRFASILLGGGYQHIVRGWESLKRQLVARSIQPQWGMSREVYQYMEAFHSPENRTEIQVAGQEKNTG